MANELDFPDVKPLTRKLTLSHFKDEEEPPELHNTTIPEALVKTATKHPDRELFIFRAPGTPRSSLTGQQLLNSTEYVAATLINTGIEAGDRVGLLSPNCPEYVAADYGILRAGAAVVRMHSSFKSGDDLLYIINKTECRGIIVVPGPDDEYLNLLHSMLPTIGESDSSAPLQLAGVPSLKFVMVSSTEGHPGMRRIDLLSQPSDQAKKPGMSALVEARQKEINPEDPCSLYLTSGSTGFPKVVALNHKHLVNGMYVNFMDGVEKFMTDRPFSHIGGNTLQGAVRGKCGVYLDPKTSVSKGNTDFFFKTIEDEQVGGSLFFPYLLNDLLEVLENKRFDLSSVSKGVVGGQCIPRNFLERCLKKLPGMLNGYGCTEAGPVLVMTRPEDPIDIKLDYTGYPGPLNEFKILDDEGNIVPVNTTGMLYLKTPLMFVCYWNDEEKTRAAKDADGWYRTDDMAVMNERGYINILGRKTEVIMKASINIYPMVIEKFLIGHPGVDQVVVVGVPDEKLFEDICACIIPVTGSDLTVQEVEQYCDENLLTGGSADGFGLRPRYFLLLEKFPLNMNQKIHKKAIKELAAKQLGL